GHRLGRGTAGRQAHAAGSASRMGGGCRRAQCSTSGTVSASNPERVRSSSPQCVRRHALL
ncbi:MAG: hypothetical protein AVDCRST_MAG71-1274, partial [uncultured Lysobacter sp.]